MKVRTRALCLTSATMIIVGMPQLATAQDAPTAAADASANSGEIIVTAQRRSERLTDVPIAIVAQSAEQLARAGAVNVRDLSLVTPGLRMSGNGFNSQPSIRGIHSDQTDPGNDPNVSLYVDGVYQANQIANNTDLADIERVEVLKGPQGTLFGRNATGGAIRLFTRSPSFETSGLVDLSYGRFDEVTAKAFITGPIAGDTVAASLSGYSQYSDGFIDNVATGRDGRGIRSRALRGKILFKPTDALSIQLIGAYAYRYDSNSTAYQAIAGNTIGRTVPGTIIPTDRREFASEREAFGKSRVYTGALKIDYESSIGTFSSTSAYNDVKARYSTDSDFTAQTAFFYDLGESQKDFSQELTFSSEKFGIAQLTAGVFYYHSVGRYDPLEFAFGPLSFGVPVASFYLHSRQQTDAYAGFGELTLEPTDNLSIILGARYSHEKRQGESDFYGSPTPQRPAMLAPIGPGQVSFNSLTPRASIRYSFAGGDNIYFTYSRGFKSGGLNISTANPNDQPFKPETVDAFEIGLKTATNRIISANISGFYYDYKNQQVQSNVNGTNSTFNAASSEIYGADADILFRPFDDFTLQAGVSWLHARFKDFANATVNIPNLACTPQPCGNVTATLDLSGGREPYAPDFTVSLTPTWRHDFAAGRFELTGSWYHSSKFFYDNNARVGQKAYDLFSARASFTPEGSNFSIYAWGRNLSNERVLATVFVSNDGDGGTYIQPRSYGIGARYEF